MKGAKQTATNSVILSKVAFVCVGISLLLSSAAFYSSWTAKSWPELHKREFVAKHHIKTRDVGRPTAAPHQDCSGTALSQYDLTTRDGALRQQVHQATCELQSVQQQLDTYVDEFNTMLFFINEIGINMQAAKNQIDANMRRVRAAHDTAEQALNVTIDNSRIIGDVEPSIEALNRLLNATVETNAKFFTDIESRTFQNELLIRSLNSSIATLMNERVPGAVENEQRPQQLPSPDAVPDVAQSAAMPAQLLEASPGQRLPASNTSLWLRQLQTKYEENSKDILSMRSSIERVKDELEHFDAGDWFNAPNGYQYYLSESAFTTDAYARSRRYCKFKGGELAYVGMRNKQHFRFLWNNLIAPARHHCVWIGMTDLEQEGKWKWLDGELLSDHWTNWAVGQPGRRSYYEDCGMVRAGYWDDGPCSGFRKICSFLCERKILSFVN